ncbi:MAG: double-cubane-cluster-containing anaerobic reductase [Thermoplasmatota archaeon]
MTEGNNSSTAKAATDPKKVQIPEGMDARSDPQLETLNRRMRSLITYLRERNRSVRSMEYFYDLADNLFHKRADELKEFRSKGGKVVGVLCNFVPEELILAAGAVPVRLAFGFSDTILTAEEYMPRNFCPLLKSSFGSFLQSNPIFDACDVVVIPTSCDGKKKLGEVLAPHKPVWMLEVPHCTNTSQGRELWLKEMRLLARKLTKLTGRRITRNRLSRSITIVNRKRAMVHRLYEARKENVSIWGRDALLVTALSYFDDIGRWTDRTEELCREIESKPTIIRPDTPRILITGSPLVAPTWKVPNIIEESGGIVVSDDICTGTKGYWDPVERNFFTSDHLVSVADRYLMNTCACFTPNTAREVRLRQFIEDWNVDGVVYHVSQACHTYGMEQHKINLEMEKLDKPVLNIETDFSQEDVEQIRTRIEAFLELITTKKRREAAAEQKLPSAGRNALPSPGSKALPASSFKFDNGFPVHEQPLGEEFAPKSGKRLSMSDLKPPGG